MDITSLEFAVEANGKPKVSVWCKCRSADDVDDIIAWLHLAKNMMQKWEKIRSRHAEAPRPPKAPAGQNEDSERGKVQGGPRLAVGADG